MDILMLTRLLTTISSIYWGWSGLLQTFINRRHKQDEWFSVILGGVCLLCATVGLYASPHGAIVFSETAPWPISLFFLSMLWASLPPAIGAFWFRPRSPGWLVRGDEEQYVASRPRFLGWCGRMIMGSLWSFRSALERSYVETDKQDWYFSAMTEARPRVPMSTAEFGVRAEETLEALRVFLAGLLRDGVDNLGDAIRGYNPGGDILLRIVLVNRYPPYEAYGKTVYKATEDPRELLSASSPAGIGTEPVAVCQAPAIRQ